MFNSNTRDNSVVFRWNQKAQSIHEIIIKASDNKMEPESKCQYLDMKSKLQSKFKPTPVLFNNKNGQPALKKMKLQENLSTATKAIATLNHSNGNSKERVRLSIQEQRRKLPVYEQRNKLLELIRRHSTLIIMGETGCGKTTQIPQYILSARLQENGKIGITQPRRVAAISIAQRVAQEFGHGVRKLTV